MVGFFIIAHAPLASALKSVAAHAFPGMVRAIEALDVPADLPLDEIEALARQALARARRPDVLVLTDVLGATPCNVAQRIAGAEGGGAVRLIAGVNVPMLWRALTYANEPLDIVAARALAGASQGVVPLSVAQAPNPIESGAHAPQVRHDQQ